MDTSSYIKFNKNQLEKIGNTVVYLSETIPPAFQNKTLKTSIDFRRNFNKKEEFLF